MVFITGQTQYYTRLIYSLDDFTGSIEFYHIQNIFYHSCNMTRSTFVKRYKPTKMRKVFVNKWFFLAAALTLSLSAFSFVTYKKTQTVCSSTANCCPDSPVNSNQKTDLLWDILSRQLSNFISIR